MQKIEITLWVYHLSVNSQVALEILKPCKLLEHSVYSICKVFNLCKYSCVTSEDSVQVT
jgi:hypothetical protein